MKGAIVGVGTFVAVVGIIVIAMSLIIVPFTTTKPVEVEKSDYWLNESFNVPAGTHIARSGSLSSGTKMHIYFIVTSGGNLDVDFFVMDETNYWKWRAGESASMTISRSRATSYDGNWTVPHNATWYFVFDNSFSWITSKGVTSQILHYWTETEDREITEHRPLIESQYSYVGIIVLLVGGGVIIWGIVAKATPKPST